MKTHLDRLWQTFDILFVTGLAVALFLGSKVTPLLVVAGVLPIPFLLHKLKDRELHVPLRTLLAPFGLYFVYSLLALFFFTGLAPSDPKPVNPSLEFYAVAIAMLAVGLTRGLQVRNLAEILHRLMPGLLLACFLLLTYLMFAGIRDACRVRGLAPWPFIPALLFSTLALLTLVGWERFSARERWMRATILALSIVVSTTFTGSRGVAVAQLGVFGCLFLLSILPAFRNKLPHWHHLGSAVAGGVFVSLSIGLATTCGPADRFSSTATTLESLVSRLTAPKVSTETAATAKLPALPTVESNQQPKSETASDTLAQATSDEAISQRLAMWQTSIAAIKESPVFGHGSLYLQKLISEPYGYQHNHNQYLTWLVTGGLLQLALGLVFLAVPWFVSTGLSLADRLLLTIAVSLLWGIAMMFDSFLNLKFYTHYYCLLCGVLYAFVNSLREGDAR
ncbi:O-antigen ligase family protein [Rhizobium sp. WL3]|uniref:O-antigen ligase family protein n=1 Tax=Rhizobium sp. WL3 TaxID=2603277 RepID=UPI0016506D71|nr:O-antigen ligase family protein [Rhizobium sp. WL3]